MGAAVVLGGVDPTGPHLFTIWPHGSVSKLPYAAMGSGSLAAMAVFEAYYKKDMRVEMPLLSLFSFLFFVLCFREDSTSFSSLTPPPQKKKKKKNRERRQWHLSREQCWLE